MGASAAPHNIFSIFIYHQEMLYPGQDHGGLITDLFIFKKNRTNLACQKISQEGTNDYNYRRRWDWSTFQPEWLGLCKLSARVSGIDQNVYRNGWNWSKLSQKGAGSRWD